MSTRRKSHLTTTPAFSWAMIPLFAGMDAESLARVDGGAHKHCYRKDADIFAEGEPCAGLHVVVNGLVRLYRLNAEGRLHTLSLLRPPSMFNEVAAVDGGVNPFNAVAVTAVEVRVIPHATLRGWMATDPALLNRTVSVLAHLNREYLERLEDMTFRTIPSRLAKLFLHETMYGDQIAETPSSLTQEDLASILGTTREVVGRALRSLVSAGLLKKVGRMVYIVDRDGLAHLAATNELPGVLETI